MLFKGNSLNSITSKYTQILNANLATKESDERGFAYTQEVLT